MTKKIDNCYKMFNDYQRMIIEAKTQKNDNPDYDPKIQKLVNKLISEETIAHDFYIGCIMAVDKDEVCCIENIFVETANDELNDHCKSLVKWAKDNGYDVPFKYKDYEKEASPSVVKQYRDLKTKQSAKFYIEEAIKSEHDAIASYEEALKHKHLPYELYSIILNNYYDEEEHLEKFQTLLTATEANATLTWY